MVLARRHGLPLMTLRAAYESAQASIEDDASVKVYRPVCLSSAMHDQLANTHYQHQDFLSSWKSSSDTGRLLSKLLVAGDRVYGKAWRSHDGCTYKDDCSHRPFLE